MNSIKVGQLAREKEKLVGLFAFDITRQAFNEASLY